MVKYEAFLKERKEILKDIEQFLVVVLKFFKYVRDNLSAAGYCNFTFVEYDNVHLLIESLCLIHGLYGYPKTDADSNDSTGNKEVVKGMLLHLNEEGTKFADVYEKVKEEDFWQFPLEDLESLPREPAHLLLKLVLEVYEKNVGIGRESARWAAKVGRMCLEDLPDMNKLKPVVWAEHGDKPECFGVSLGVRHFVRPLFLYIKLSQLKNTESFHHKIQLHEVHAYERVHRRVLKKDKSKYQSKKDPCVSCQVFFNKIELSINNKPKTATFPPFGNCAEYDVIDARSNLNSLLDELGVWHEVKSACKRHFMEFKFLRENLAGNQSSLKHYYESNKKGKILMYEQRGEDHEPKFALKVMNWPLDKVINTSARRRYTEP